MYVTDNNYKYYWSNSKTFYSSNTTFLKWWEIDLSSITCPNALVENLRIIVRTEKENSTVYFFDVYAKFE